ncbi:hypothetical protein M3J09_008046 [Ascochyta lentis]
MPAINKHATSPPQHKSTEAHFPRPNAPSLSPPLSSTAAHNSGSSESTPSRPDPFLCFLRTCQSSSPSLTPPPTTHDHVPRWVFMTYMYMYMNINFHCTAT